MTIINLTTPMSDDKERQQRNKAVLDAIERYTDERMAVDYVCEPADGSRSGGQPAQGYGVVTAANYTSPIGGAGVVTHGVVSVTKDPAAEWQAGYEAGVEAAVKVLKADARLCDCAAPEANECACGAWDDYKSITSARAVEIVRKLADTQ